MKKSKFFVLGVAIGIVALALAEKLEKWEFINISDIDSFEEDDDEQY